MAAVAGLLAVLCQLFAGALVGPAQAAAAEPAALTGFAIPLCHAKADADGPDRHRDGKPAPCLSCPLCQAALRLPLVLPPDPVLIRVAATSITEFEPAPCQPRFRDSAVEEAAPPRGPPSAMWSVA